MRAALEVETLTDQQTDGLGRSFAKLEQQIAGLSRASRQKVTKLDEETSELKEVMKEAFADSGDFTQEMGAELTELGAEMSEWAAEATAGTPASDASAMEGGGKRVCALPSQASSHGTLLCLGKKCAAL